MRDNKGKFVKGHEVPNKWRISCSKQFSGKKLSKEICNKISQSLIGNTRNLDTKRPNQTGEKHWKWKGGRIIKNGYSKILFNGKYILEHHLNWCIANNFLYIPKGMVVHHKNEDKLDNNPENLVLLPNNYHTKLHWEVEKQQGINRFRGGE